MAATTLSALRGHGAEGKDARDHAARQDHRVERSGLDAVEGSIGASLVHVTARAVDKYEVASPLEVVGRHQGNPGGTRRTTR
jgi:hypothetical protein